MIPVDIACDLMDGDETGHVWTFLREARDPALIEPGAIVVAGNADAPAVAEVVDVVEKPAGPMFTCACCLERSRTTQRSSGARSRRPDAPIRPAAARAQRADPW